jgi:phage shock protein PspC (stress-responsive transcriptional regulator)
MSNAQHDSTAGPGAPGGDWWTRRPHRSANDRKVAGVAGGLGRAFGIDPVLFRVGFVILFFAGGFGLLFYVLGWLLLPADGDEVSAGEALLGRGQSSTPPVLAVGLGIVAVMSIATIFSWGLPVAPLIIGGLIVVLVMRKRGRMSGCARHGGPSQHAGDWSARMGQRAESWGAQAEQWVARQPWSGTGPSTGGTSTGDATTGTEPPSPFEKPAFWDEDSAGRTPGQSRVNLSKDVPAQPAAAAEPTPPAWDPLGVAPFAWDLPEPSPAPPPPPVPQSRGVVGRVTMGAVLLVGGLATVGVFAGWWHLTWAGVAATALVVVALGLLIGSLRGRGKGLIGPGIFLAALTIALTMTGIDGTGGYGQQTWTPTTVSGVQSEYVMNGGQGRLDLRDLALPANSVVNTDIEVRAGQASVIVPDDATVNVTCSTNAGDVDCLGNVESGLHKATSATQKGSSDKGTINLSVHVGAGQAEVRNG